MSRYVERHPQRMAPLKRTPDRDARLRGWLQFEVEAAFGSRSRLEGVWREARRQYEGIPRTAVRSSPVPNMPNIEVPIGATLTFVRALSAVGDLDRSTRYWCGRASLITCCEDFATYHLVFGQYWVGVEVSATCRFVFLIEDPFR